MKTFREFLSEGRKTVFKTDTFDLGVKWYEDDERGVRSAKLTTIDVGMKGMSEISKIAPRFGNGMYDIIRLSNGNAGIKFTRKGKSYINAKVFGTSYTDAKGEKYLDELLELFKKLVKRAIHK